MKHKLHKIITCLVLTMLVCLTCVSTAFAEENVAEFEVNTVSSTRASSGDDDLQTLPAKGTVNLYPTLNSYIGLYKTFYFCAYNTYYDTKPTGTVRVYVYKPNGNLLRYFEVGVDEAYRETFFLPPSGKYTVQVYSEVGKKLLAGALWEA